MPDFSFFEKKKIRGEKNCIFHVFWPIFVKKYIFTTHSPTWWLGENELCLVCKETRGGDPPAIFQSTASRSSTPLRHQGTLVANPSEKADIFNTLFASKSTVAQPNAATVEMNQTCDRVMKPIRIHSRVVAKLLRSVDPAKAPGLDQIPGIVLNECVCQGTRLSLGQDLPGIAWHGLLSTPVENC